jgi:hypothetical protein
VSDKRGRSAVSWVTHRVRCRCKEWQCGCVDWAVRHDEQKRIASHGIDDQFVWEPSSQCQPIRFVSSRLVRRSAHRRVVASVVCGESTNAALVDVTLPPARRHSWIGWYRLASFTRPTVPNRTQNDSPTRARAQHETTHSTNRMRVCKTTNECKTCSKNRSTGWRGASMFVSCARRVALEEPSTCTAAVQLTSAHSATPSSYAAPLRYHPLPRVRTSPTLSRAHAHRHVVARRRR